MIDLTRLLPGLLRANGGNAELAVKLAWTRAAGAGLRPHAIPFRLDGRTLIVSVADAIWQKQLQSMSSELIFRLNNILGQSVVDTLAFLVDSAAISEAQAKSCAPRSEERRRTPVPTELLFAARSIGDEELRQRFIRAAENCIARRDSAEHGNPSPEDLES